MIIFKNLAELKAAEGQDLGTTEWLTITQEMINDFAKATHDFQWIHIDPEAAKQSPFGGTIAHGFLTISLASKFIWELFKVENVKMAVNYGLNKVRFMGVVPSGGRVRMNAILKKVGDYQENGVKAEFTISFELEGSKKPVCIAEWIALQFE